MCPYMVLYGVRFLLWARTSPFGGALLQTFFVLASRGVQDACSLGSEEGLSSNTVTTAGNR